jgi:type IV pilus assembly protein PilB
MSEAARRATERRKEFRSPVLETIPVTISGLAEPLVGQMKKISPTGADLLLDAAPVDPPKITGQAIELSFTHHHAACVRAARIAWCSRVEGEWCMGVEFTQKHAECPGLLALDMVKIDPVYALRLAPSLALRRNVLPFAGDETHVYVACQELPDPATTQSLEKIFAHPVKYEIAEPATLKRMLERVYGDLQNNPHLQQRSRSVDLRTAANLQSDDIVGLCEELLHAAILRQASDIHLDCEASGVHVRFRVDGLLDTYRRLPAAVQSGLLSRFKVLAGMDIAEKRAPQDGGFKHQFGRGKQAVDIRVATLPTRHGERMTLRLLALQTESLTLEKLGMAPRDLAIFEQTLDRPHGMILLTGPTGAGKSTTLYAAVRRLMERESLNIITVEDPIEYEIAGVAQTEVDQADKVTFLKALRSVLRHDPDVVMIGEIRDRETAEVAIKASLTGHLVFSTLHTNSAAGVVTRLTDMGIDRFLIAATLRLAVAQRLVRRLCPRCRSPRELTLGEATALGRPESAGREVHDPKGCIYCGKRGFIGRLGLFEMIPFDDDWSRRIAQGADETAILTRLREEKIASLVDDGFEKVQQGMTSVKDVLGAVTAW